MQNKKKNPNLGYKGRKREEEGKSCNQRDISVQEENTTSRILQTKL